MATRTRPKYLNLRALLFEIRLPLPGWISILHRASGALLFVAMIWLLSLLDRSLASERDFAALRQYLSLPLIKIVLIVLIWAYCHHFCAGIRFLLLDLQYTADKSGARRSSAAVLVSSLALTALFGWKLW